MLFHGGLIIAAKITLFDREVNARPGLFIVPAVKNVKKNPVAIGDRIFITVLNSIIRDK